MAGSYREIDYRVRPAKHAERLMLCDALRRLKFATVESYQYVGMGSVYFADFALFHRALGISTMISIESKEHDKQRFLDNLPFAHIDMRFGLTTTHLPSLNLSLRTIAWFDYDGPLSKLVLDDIRSFVSRAASGSVLLITVQCQPPRIDGQDLRKNVSELAKQLGGDRVDPKLDDRDLIGWNTANVFRRIMLNEIAASLEKLNGVRPGAQKMEFRQIVYFQYRDGAHMLTVGGVLFDKGQTPLFEQSGFSDLDFVRSGDDPFRIDVPLLTPREIRLLDAQMPLRPGISPSLGSIPANDASQYIKIYRYFPHFIPVDPH